MKNRFSGACSFGVGLMMVTILGACAAAGSHSVPEDPPIRSVLEQEIRAKLARSVFPVAWNASRMQITSRASGAVPGLVYHYGTYHVPEVSHGFAFAVAGSLQGRRSILRTANDWAVLAAGWRPDDEAGVLRACSELIETVGADPDPTVPPLVIVDPLSLRSPRVPPGLRLSSPVILPQVHIQDSRAHASVWALEPGIRRLYTCAFEWGARRSSAQLVVTDSLPGQGLLPRGP
jgi:hypothetical protein